MKEDMVDPRIETEKLNKSLMFSNRSFMVEIIDNSGLVTLHPHMINNFSIDDENIFITVYDMLNNNNIIEETLDEWSKGFWIFKKQLNVILYRLDSVNNEVYKVVYSGCKLKKYHGKNFTYKSNDIHQWYLEMSFKKKKIIKNEVYFSENQVNNTDEEKQFVNDQLIKNYELKVLKNSNKMLDDAVKTVKITNKINKRNKKKVIEQIDNAKTENNDLANKYYGKSLKDFDLSKMENMIEKQIVDLEGEINK